MTTYTYSLTRDNLLQASFRLMGVFNEDNPVPPTDLQNAAQALNLMIKQCMIDGKPLWTVQEIQVPLVQGLGTITNPYVLGPNGIFSTFKPLGINFARLNYGASNLDVPLTSLSRQEYMMLGQKANQGTPNSYCFDPQTTFANLYIYVVPDAYNASNNSIWLTVQRPLADMNNSTDSFDFPIECLNYIKYGVAAELCLEYDVPTAKTTMIMQKAAQLKDMMYSNSQEEASTFFTVETQMR